MSMPDTIVTVGVPGQLLKRIKQVCPWLHTVSLKGKIELLRKLFHRRQDVYAQRRKARNETGKYSYWTARKHDWSVPHKPENEGCAWRSPTS